MYRTTLPAVLFLAAIFLAFQLNAQNKKDRNKPVIEVAESPQSKFNDSLAMLALKQQLNTSNEHLAQLVNLGKTPVPKNQESWFESIDAALDTSLAATMAGLAIAAATFLLSLAGAQADKIQQLTAAQVSTVKAKEVQKKMKKGANDLMWSFYFFVVFLLESVTLDKWEADGGFLTGIGLAEWGDVGIAGFCFAGGLFLLWRGANGIRAIVLE